MGACCGLETPGGADCPDGPLAIIGTAGLAGVPASLCGEMRSALAASRAAALPARPRPIPGTSHSRARVKLDLHFEGNRIERDLSRQAMGQDKHWCCRRRNNHERLYESVPGTAGRGCRPCGCGTGGNLVKTLLPFLQLASDGQAVPPRESVAPVRALPGQRRHRATACFAWTAEAHLVEAAERAVSLIAGA